ncbi:winged helix-turn-helix domain-containing protein [Erwinia psidii]|uniref:Transcriptional regulator n=1 Tax=Erwinia psidii TaxID=69224 RepID=A0A3N6V097_9GAMM|nr:transcriptional regulator [Erwinia psidii]MCX8957873.1 transcriptional regulator [Erwinia psidii]MCX8960924.1 transcriptional regulator [Erwinia psidii]MCX8964836.1 transcriptional regulator [Erwinia psidii]RQM38485.1 transcriptional regulator [Erwinia psidii]
MSSRCVIHHWLIDIASGSLIHQQTGEQRRLGEYQFKLLMVLVQHAGQILTRDELNTLVWERRVIGNNSLPNAIHALRVALEDDGKQQRIIKTIPKKGYIIEAEFCTVQQQQSRDDAATHVPTHHRGAPTRPDVGETWNEESRREHPPLTQPPQEKHKRFWRWMCLAQTILLVLVVGFLSPGDSGKARDSLTEQEFQLYSQIRIFALTQVNDGQTINEDITGIMSNTFFALNEMLAVKGITMQVFYSTTSTTLKYTLVIGNACDHRQLAMNIAQFRSNTGQLNTLIYRETERKINEMANCINRPDGTDVNNHRIGTADGPVGSGDETVHAAQ